MQQNKTRNTHDLTKLVL